MPHKEKTNLIRWLSKLTMIVAATVLFMTAAIPLVSEVGVKSNLITTVRAAKPAKKGGNKKGGNKNGGNKKGQKKGKKSKKGGDNSNAGDSGGGTGSQGGGDPLEDVAEEVTAGEKQEESHYSGMHWFHDIAKAWDKMTSKAKGINKDSNPGNQWSGLGGKNGFLGAATKSSATTDYSTLTSRPVTKKEGQAAEYGGVLYLEGFDHSNNSSIGSDPFKRLGRIIGGLFLLVGELLNMADYWMMKHLMSFFNLFNPIAWVSNHTYAAHSIAFAPVVGTMRRWLHEAALIGMVFVLFSIGYGLAHGLIMWDRGTQPHDAFKGVFRAYRRLFGILVVNLMVVAAFSMTVSWLSNTFDQDGDSASDYAVYSTLINDRDWITHSRLALPKDANNILPFGEKHWNSGAMPPPSHEMALAINGDGAGIPPAKEALDNDSFHGNAADGHQNDKYDAPMAKMKKGYDPSTLHMVLNWFNDSGYTAPDWSSYVKAHLPQQIDAGDESKAAKHLSAKKPKYLDKIVPDDPNHDTVGDPHKGPWPYINNGTLKVNGQDKYTSAPPITESPNGSNSTHGGDLSPAADGGLSTIGMYNYLLTVFSDTNMTWTKGDNLMNSVSQPEHKNVGMTGTGFSTLGNFILMVAMMLCVAILGMGMILYDFRIVFASIPRILGYDFGNNLGIWTMTLRFVLTAVSVIFTLIFTSVVFMIGRQLLIAFSEIPDQFFGKMAYNNQVKGGLIFHILNAHMSSAQAGAFNSTLYSGSSAVMGILLFIATWVLCRAWRQIRDVFDRSVSNMLKQMFNHRSNRGSAINHSNRELNMSNNSNVNGGNNSSLLDTKSSNRNGGRGGSNNNTAGLSNGGNNDSSSFTNPSDERGDEINNAAQQAASRDGAPDNGNVDKGNVDKGNVNNGGNSNGGRNGINNPGGKNNNLSNNQNQAGNRNGRNTNAQQGGVRKGLHNGDRNNNLDRGNINSNANKGDRNNSINKGNISKGLNRGNVKNGVNNPYSKSSNTRGLNTTNSQNSMQRPNPELQPGEGNHGGLSTNNTLSPSEAANYANIADQANESDNRTGGLNTSNMNGGINSSPENNGGLNSIGNQNGGNSINSQDGIPARDVNGNNPGLQNGGVHNGGTNVGGSKRANSQNSNRGYGLNADRGQNGRAAVGQGQNAIGRNGQRGTTDQNNVGQNGQDAEQAGNEGTMGLNTEGENPDMVQNGNSSVTGGKANSQQSNTHATNHGNRPVGLKRNNTRKGIHNGNRLNTQNRRTNKGLNKAGGRHGVRNAGLNTQSTNNPSAQMNAGNNSRRLNSRKQVGAKSGLNSARGLNGAKGLNDGAKPQVQPSRQGLNGHGQHNITNRGGRTSINNGKASQGLQSSRHSGRVASPSMARGSMRRAPRTGLATGMNHNRPSSIRDGQRRIRMALSSKRSADRAYHQVSGMGKNASPTQLRETRQRQANAAGQLKRARLGTAQLQESRPVQPHMLRSGFSGTRPTNGQARAALQHVSTARKSFLKARAGGNPARVGGSPNSIARPGASGVSGSAPAPAPDIKTASTNYINSMQHANSIGLSPSTYEKDAPDDTLHEIDNNVARVLNTGLGGR